MRAAVMRDARLVVEDIATPEPGSGEVLVKTLACGICGSDLHALKHIEIFAESAREADPDAPVFQMDPQKDLVMGHEFCAEILDHGPDTAKTLKPGTRICSVPITLRQGSVCSIGYSNDVPGGYAENMVLFEPLLLPVPNGLSSEYAALTEPMAAGRHAA
ncbi:MAG: alcohol dehydrogenase catalytic domain-containing protein, partial [Pseudomonadales bacterium]|nr:alcohol dehydrogenase catalytic domain-containing protein [Pseudomonadales bacterium]